MIVRVNKTLEEYLKELGCSNSLYYEILSLNGISAGYQIFNSVNDYGNQLFTDYIAFDCFNIYPGIPYCSYRFRYDYVEISLLEELTDIIKKYLKLKAFI